MLLAKDAVSTGWDCPRAEVLVSLRPAVDATYVTQLLGRMVRTPLAQTTGDERLNAASCYLPRFDKDTAKQVAEEIMGLREPASGERGAAVAKVMLKPVMLSRNTEVPDEVFDVVESLPSFAKPAAAPKPVKAAYSRLRRRSAGCPRARCQQGSARDAVRSPRRGRPRQRRRRGVRREADPHRNRSGRSSSSAARTR
ncbi:hypothetical protein [Branchiibius hedensis]|uniref:hypothetical protein n=1 Tax=Branchiibius hedensis TaxID=672460 RepID=UPI000D6B2B59|nr:hypothetical protein [Branchiibius hedensis]